MTHVMLVNYSQQPTDVQVEYATGTLAVGATVNVSLRQIDATHSNDGKGLEAPEVLGPQTVTQGVYSPIGAKVHLTPCETVQITIQQ